MFQLMINQLLLLINCIHLPSVFRQIENMITINSLHNQEVLSLIIT
jgi:hypothetical protein